MDNIFYFIEGLLVQNSLLAIPLSFMGGILISLSPCVLPILPITMGVIANISSKSKLNPWLLSFIFVAGVTTTYITLGVIAAVFGIFLQALLKPFIIYRILGIVCFVLAISFFELFHFSLFNVNYTPKHNEFSLYIVGLITGLSMLPCAFPVLGTILSFMSLGKNIGYAIANLTSFSLGYGLVLLLIGRSTAYIRFLSEKKNYFIIIKKILGVLMILLGLYFIIFLGGKYV